jgi:hypothetical protein
MEDQQLRYQPTVEGTSRPLGRSLGAWSRQATRWRQVFLGRLQHCNDTFDFAFVAMDCKHALSS